MELYKNLELSESSLKILASCAALVGNKQKQQNQLKMTRSLNMCVLVALFVTFLAATASAQMTFEEFEGHAATIGELYQTTQAEVQNSKGVFIRTAYKHGCLTSGIYNLWFRQVRIKPFLLHHRFSESQLDPAAENSNQ